MKQKTRNAVAIKYGTRRSEPAAPPLAATLGHIRMAASVVLGIIVHADGCYGGAHLRSECVVCKQQTVVS
jgi:hypothetical protein